MSGKHRVMCRIIHSRKSFRGTETFTYSLSTSCWFHFQTFSSTLASRRPAFTIAGNGGRKQQMPLTGVVSTVSAGLCERCATYAPLFFHLDPALLTPSVRDDAAAACRPGPDCCWLTTRQATSALFSRRRQSSPWQIRLTVHIRNERMMKLEMMKACNVCGFRYISNCKFGGLHTKTRAPRPSSSSVVNLIEKTHQASLGSRSQLTGRKPLVDLDTL